MDFSVRDVGVDEVIQYMVLFNRVVVAHFRFTINTHTVPVNPYAPTWDIFLLPYSWEVCA